VVPLLAAPFVPVRPFAWDAALPDSGNNDHEERRRD
jgi:hypothetical protein